MHFIIISPPIHPCVFCIKLYPRFQNFQPRFRGWCRDLPGSSQQQDRREPATWGWGCGVSFCLGIKGPTLGMQFKYQFKHTLLFILFHFRSLTLSHHRNVIGGTCVYKCKWVRRNIHRFQFQSTYPSTLKHVHFAIRRSWTRGSHWSSSVWGWIKKRQRKLASSLVDLEPPEKGIASETPTTATLHFPQGLWKAYLSYFGKIHPTNCFLLQLWHCSVRPAFLLGLGLGS